MAELPDRIAEIFRDKTVFITGGTGFVGKVLVEKLLRVTDVKKIYVLIRQKKGKNPKERLQEIFNNCLFDLVNEQKPQAVRKCSLIYGDLTKNDLGISKGDRETLRNEIDFIFHPAATIRFDDTVKNTVTSNTRGTKLILDFAKECKHLRLFLHVSTSYLHTNDVRVYEKYYDPPANPHELLDGLECMRDETMEEYNRRTRGEVPNSYIFSKALAETLVNEHVGKIPLIITRLGVVIPLMGVPLRGWSNNIQGAERLLAYSGIGIIRSVYADGKAMVGFMPADGAVNVMMVAAWNYLSNKNSPYIFNVTIPEKDFKTTWKVVIDIWMNVVRNRFPFNNTVWYPGLVITKNRAFHNFVVFLFNVIPTVITDLLLLPLGYKMLFYNFQKKINRIMAGYACFITRSWSFETRNIETIRETLNEREKKIYTLNYDGKGTSCIEDYMADCILFMRRHIFNQTDDMISAARRKMKIMYIVDRVCRTSFMLGVTYYLYNHVLTLILLSR